MQTLVRLGHYDRLIVWTRYENIGGKRLSQVLSVILLSSRIEPRINNPAVANLHSYPLSCNAATLDIRVKCFPKYTTAGYAQ